MVENVAVQKFGDDGVGVTLESSHHRRPQILSQPFEAADIPGQGRPRDGCDVLRWKPSSAILVDCLEAVKFGLADWTRFDDLA